MLMKFGASALVIAVLAGCAGGRAPGASPEPSPSAAPLTIAAVAGDYTLVTVDGQKLPYAPRAARPVVSGSLTVSPNGTFSLQTAYEQESPTTAPAFSGACYAEGNEVKMVWDDGGSTTLTVRGDTVFLRREGALYAYLRGR